VGAALQAWSARSSLIPASGKALVDQLRAVTLDQATRLVDGMNATLRG
jgi:hypothetical protein